MFAYITLTCLIIGVIWVISVVGAPLIEEFRDIWTIDHPLKRLVRAITLAILSLILLGFVMFAGRILWNLYLFIQEAY